METYLLEINMISAQGLKPLSAANKKHCPNPMQAYAIAWIDPAFKLRTSVDSVNRENPCWNDKFLFRVTDDFLSSETAAVNIEIYSAGDYLKEKDPLIGTVRFLVNNQLSTGVASPATGVGFGSASFTAVQVRRPSGRFHGALNIGTMVINASDISIFSGISSSAAYRDIMGGEACNDQKRKRSRRQNIGAKYFSSSEEDNFSDTNSTCSSSTTTSTSSSTGRSVTGSRFLCGLGLRRQKSSESISSELAD